MEFPSPRSKHIRTTYTHVAAVLLYHYVETAVHVISHAEWRPPSWFTAKRTDATRLWSTGPSSVHVVCVYACQMYGHSIALSSITIILTDNWGARVHSYYIILPAAYLHRPQILSMLQYDFLFAYENIWWHDIRVKVHLKLHFAICILLETCFQ